MLVKQEDSDNTRVVFHLRGSVKLTIDIVYSYSVGRVICCIYFSCVKMILTYGSKLVDVQMEESH